MWGTIVSALCNHVEAWPWVSSLRGRRRPGRLPGGHEGCSGATQDVDPGCEELWETERPCELRGTLPLSPGGEEPLSQWLLYARADLGSADRGVWAAVGC